MIKDAKYYRNKTKENKNSWNKYYTDKSRKIILKSINKQSKLGKDALFIYDYEFFESRIFYYNREHRAKQLFNALVNDLNYYRSLGFNADISKYGDLPISKIIINWE